MKLVHALFRSASVLEIAAPAETWSGGQGLHPLKLKAL